MKLGSANWRQQEKDFDGADSTKPDSTGDTLQVVKTEAGFCLDESFAV
jgi:hypothetical protein